jgi:hypothetical protein
VPLGSGDVVVIVRFVTVMLSCWVAETPAESVTLIVKVEVPSEVGVPEMLTALVVLLLSVSPAGKLPEEIAQVNGDEVPLELTVAL